MLGTVEFIDAKELCHHTTYLGRCIELSLTLTALGSKVLHQIFICITQKVIISSTVMREVECIIFKYADKL